VVTRGRGVSIHRGDCPNVLNREGKQHLLQAYWEECDGSYPVEIEITAIDRPQILSDVVNAVSESKVNITSLNGRSNRDRMSTIHMTVMVRNREHLENVINKVNRVRDVFDVHRIGG
jgi:GTP pyrophosphokinase